MTNRATGITRTPRDETLEILRRIEPVLDGIQNQLGRMEQRVEKIEQRVEKIELRVEKIEQQVEKLDQRVERLEQRAGGVERDLSELKGRVSMLPTIWQLIGPLTAIMVAVMASAAGLVGLIRFAAGGP